MQMVLLSGCLFLVRFGVLHSEGGLVALRFVMISVKDRTQNVDFR